MKIIPKPAVHKKFFPELNKIFYCIEIANDQLGRLFVGLFENINQFFDSLFQIKAIYEPSRQEIFIQYNLEPLKRLGDNKIAFMFIDFMIHFYEVLTNSQNQQEDLNLLFITHECCHKIIN